jgi:asparagine synthase (glutamine-hydrolysing)
MCGLCGIASVQEGPNHRAESAQAMLAALHHRGPDHQSLRDYGGLALGHARLSIIDTTAGSNQPMADAGNRFHIIYNGEIYNYLELREECRARGYAFSTSGDTEVILACVNVMGVDEALRRLRGMFAFVLYDQAQQRLILARDRFGQKPLYYTRSPEGDLLFASEVKALLASGRVEANAWDEDALVEYFLLGASAQEKTVYRGINELKAGHLAVYGIKSGTLDIRRYATDTRAALSRDSMLSLPEALDTLDTLLTQSVKMHLRSDVGAALFLSGGIDSGLIAGIAAKLQYPLHTLTISTGDGHYDESAAASLTARHVGLTHQIVPIEQDIARDIDAVFASYDEPIADPSIIPTWYVTRAGAQYSRVFLTGDGSDEMFMGYRRYRAASLRDRLGWLDAAPLRPLYRRIATLIPPAQRPHALRNLAGRMLLGLAQDKKSQRLDYFTQGLTRDDLKAMLKPHFDAALENVYENLLPVPEGDYLDMTQLQDIDYQLPDTLLVKMDMAAMRHSIETRAPFLDDAVADFALAQPAVRHLRGGQGKALLRELARRYLPPEIAAMPKKGFEIPIFALLSGPLARSAREAVMEAPLLGRMFGRAALEDLLMNKNALPPQPWARKLWLVYAFAMWEKTRP